MFYLGAVHFQAELFFSQPPKNDGICRLAASSLTCRAEPRWRFHPKKKSTEKCGRFGRGGSQGGLEVPEIPKNDVRKSGVFGSFVRRSYMNYILLFLSLLLLLVLLKNTSWIYTARHGFLGRQCNLVGGNKNQFLIFLSDENHPSLVP